MVNRTFGWVQNPSSFLSLKNTVQIFIPGSKNHGYLCSILKDFSVIKDEVLAKSLYAEINRKNIQLSYHHLAGTGSIPRKSAPCNGLVQASISDQKKIKGYVDNWTADGFIRWAECLGFINYHEKNDTFTLTELGRHFGCTSDELEYKDNNFLIKGLLQYPPVHRILSILNEDPTKIYSKFEIGAKLGFTGEAGFTSIPHYLIMQHLSNEFDPFEIKTIKQNREGSSDKYARMICGWLSKVGLVLKSGISVNNIPLEKNIILGHAFKISSKGIRTLSKIEGKSKHKRIIKNVSWYMLATAAKNNSYLRTRRAKLLKFLEKKKKATISEITKHMKREGFFHKNEVFIKDLKGLNNCGISIREEESEINDKIFSLTSLICNFKIPHSQETPKIKDEKLEQLKESYLTLMPSIDSDYVELIEISRDKSQCLIFESKVVEIFNKEYNLPSIHLGGASKPDSLSQFKDENVNFGLIVDSKAYKKGYSLSASEKDKMVRYITENRDRDKNINQTEWWRYFHKDIQNYNFLFVSSFFSLNISDGLQAISRRTGIYGGALNIEQLLLGAQMIKEGSLLKKDIPKYLNNSLVEFKNLHLA